MVEATEHSVYALLKSKYERVALDYVILKTDQEYEGMETHRNAILDAFHILSKRLPCYDHGIDIETDKMFAAISSIDELLGLPDDKYYDRRLKRNRSFHIPVPLPYWFAFLEPPHSTPYLKSDFVEFNDILFPNKADTEVYRWNDEFSNYFQDGKEWWGTGLWTAFDKKTRLMVVIGASLTD